MKRLENLEEVARDLKGMQKTFAIQPGREIRVIADSKQISDEDSIWLSKSIAKKEQSKLTYPGEIKITVLRETRPVDFAR